MTVVKEFAIPLRLTSPLTHGPRVKDAQWLMAGNNRFDGLAPYKDGKVDGVYGHVTALAVKRTKFWLGYPLGACDQVFGQTLYEYLRVKDWRPLPTANQKLRAARLKAAQKNPGELALAEAATHLGYVEGANNDNIFGRWYGMNHAAWCAIFESYCFGHTGHPGFRFSYVPYLYDAARHGKLGVYLVATPRVGDLALYDWSGEPLAHTAFVKTVPSRGYFTDLGGNTGSNFANGGTVAANRRATSLVHAWVRVAG